jgi:hypothetical protein
MENQYTYSFQVTRLREAPRTVLRSHRVIAALALAKPTPKASPLFHYSAFFYWKAGQS